MSCLWWARPSGTRRSQSTFRYAVRSVVNQVTPELFRRYPQFAGQSISRAQAEERMFAKVANPRLLTDMRPLLPLAQAEALSADATKEAFERVFEGLVVKIAGETSVRTDEMKERFGLGGGPSVQKTR